MSGSTEGLQWSDVASHLTGLAHAATVSGDGEPSVAIVSPLIEDHTVWIACFRSSRLARNIASTRRTSLVWEDGTEAYVWGDAELVDDADTKHRLWPIWNYDAAGFFGSPDSVGYALVRATPTRASVMTMTETGPSVLRWTA